jgi:hypothetical protein
MGISAVIFMAVLILAVLIILLSDPGAPAMVRFNH